MNTSTKLGTFSKGLVLHLSGSSCKLTWVLELVEGPWLDFDSSIQISIHQIYNLLIQNGLEQGLYKNYIKMTVKHEKELNLISNQENAIKTTVRYQQMPTRLAKNLTFGIYQMVRCVCITQITLWVCTLVQPLWKSGIILKHLKLLVHYSVIP